MAEIDLKSLERRMKNHTAVSFTAVVVLTAAELEQLIRSHETIVHLKDIAFSNADLNADQKLILMRIHLKATLTH